MLISHKEINLPLSAFIPTWKHFFKRQCWQDFLVAGVMSHLPFASHLNFLALDRRKNSWRCKDYEVLGVIHISADAKFGNFLPPLPADSQLTFWTDPPFLRLKIVSMNAFHTIKKNANHILRHFLKQFFICVIFF